jgi:ABC-2 type transport system permease protein
VSAIGRLVSGELIKLRTTRTALGFTVAVALLTLAIVLITILAGNPQSIADKRSALAAGSSISTLLLVFGIVGAGGEYRHRTLAPALLAAPGRGRLLAARVLAYGLAGLVIGLVLTVVTFAIGLPLLAGQPGPDLGAVDYLRAGGGGLLTIVLSTMLGVGAGTLVGKQVPAVIGALVWLFILEPLSGLLGGVSKFAIGQTATAIGGDSGGDVLPWVAAFLVLLAWTGLFVLAAALVDRRRDIA